MMTRSPDPDEGERTMRRAERLNLIVRKVADGGSASVAEIARDLGVSPSTVRRDLRVLDGRRLLDRTHGGAVAHGGLFEIPLEYRDSRNAEEKARIGRVTAERVEDGCAVGLTGGTTTAQIARALRDRARLTVVTNALNVANELGRSRGVKVVMTGGMLRVESHELVGPLAETSLERVHLDVLFLGVDGIDLAAGFTTHDEMEAQTDAMFIRRARSVIVVADASKFGRVAFSPICSIGQVGELITDRGGENDEVARGLVAAGIKVTFV
jgi:DeoR family transcriptional regulator of aga operon